MAKYRHEAIERGYANDAIREVGETVVLSKPLAVPSSWLKPLDYEHVGVEKDGELTYEIKYNKGIAPYVEGVEVVEDPDEDFDDEDEPKVKASQGAVDLAKEMQIDLADVEGSGAEGAVIKKDVEAFIAASKGDAI